MTAQQEPQRSPDPAGTPTGSAAPAGTPADFELVEQRPVDPAAAAALADVVAARQALADELVRLEASARAAVDIRAKVKRNPGKTAAAVGGAAFLAVGGPRKTFRAVRHRVFGRPDPLPPSLLPEQVDKAVRALGDDGAKVRGALEREFERFLAEERRADRRFSRRLILAAAVPLVSRGLKLAFDRLETASAEDVAAREDAIRARVERGAKPPTG